MKRRRAIGVLVVGTSLLALLGGVIAEEIHQQTITSSTTIPSQSSSGSEVSKQLNTLLVKGRAPKTGYSRDEFGNGWAKVQGCSTRDIILYRDLTNVVLKGECTVESGVLADVYSGETIRFTRQQSSIVQIDHVVALSDAWQKGAQQLTKGQRKQLANDPLELLAVSGEANQAKSDGDAATWLPKNKAFRCEYVERQIAVKVKYSLWVTAAEKEAMQTVLRAC